MLLGTYVLLMPLSFGVFRGRGMQLYHIRHASNQGAMRVSKVVCYQIITDIDDTVKSSGGVTLAGIPLGGVDNTYTRNAFYPGVFQFGLELARSGGRLPWRRATPPNVAVLTARAKELQWALEITPRTPLCMRYAQAGEDCGLKDWGVGTVLYGSVAEWVCQERKGWRKFENFKILYAQSRKRQQFIFIGDNGLSERDLEAAERIITAFPDALRAVFLHAVSGEEQLAPLPADCEYQGVPIRFFRTYAAAAAKAFELRLIRQVALRRIVDAVEVDMARDATNVSPGSANEQLLREEARMALDTIARPRDGLRRFLRTSSSESAL